MKSIQEKTSSTLVRCSLAPTAASAQAIEIGHYVPGIESILDFAVPKPRVRHYH